VRLAYYLPQYHFVERHSITVNSTPEKVYEAFWQLDMAESKMIKTLLKMRGTYGLLFTGKSNKQSSPGLSIKDLIGKSGLPFSLYWAVIRLFSGWIRLEMLRMIKEQAEGNTACPEK